MAYSAFVPCNCYREGKVNVRPPYEEFIIEGENWLELNLDWEGNREKHNEFWRWRHGNVCQHNNMEYCEEDLSNATGMGNFRFLCHELGEDKFPILNRYLPRANGGNLPGKYASQLLEELNTLNKIDTVIEEYAYIIQPLVKLANASIETGNNIYWT